MRIGCPAETENHEYRVCLTPESAGELVMRGHEVWIVSGAGAGIDASDDQYRGAGAHIVDGPGSIFAECEMVVKVKEPQAAERARLREGQILYTYLHLTPDPYQTTDFFSSGATAIAFETVIGPGRTLPRDSTSTPAR
jgi:alanine dehydrogenase